ncbi:MAG: nitroreductase family protein [Pseudomonadota bacterium]
MLPKKTAETSVPLHDLIHNRWSPRAYSDRPVAKEDLIAVLEAARWAASCNNMQPWRYVVATKDDPEEHQRMVQCLKTGNQEWAPAAPVLMIALAHLKRPNGDDNRHAFHDTGGATALLTLEAAARGLSVRQMAGIEVDKVRETYAVPDDHGVVAGIALGYQAPPDVLPEHRQEPEVAPRERNALADMVFAGSFGKKSSLVS